MRLLLFDAREFPAIKRIVGELIRQTSEQRPGLAGVVVAQCGNRQQQASIRSQIMPSLRGESELGESFFFVRTRAREAQEPTYRRRMDA